MGSEAGVRTRYLKDFLTAIDRAPSSVGDRIRENISAGTLEAIDSGALLGWVPFRYNVELTHAIQGVMDDRQAQQFFRNLLNTVYGTTLFYQFIQGVIRIFDDSESPSGMARMIPRGLGLLFVDVGDWSVECPDGNHAVVRVSNLPLEADRRWLESVRHSFYSVFDQTDASGQVVLDDASDAADCAVYRMHWISRTISPPPMPR